MTSVCECVRLYSLYGTKLIESCCKLFGLVAWQDAFLLVRLSQGTDSDSDSDNSDAVCHDRVRCPNRKEASGLVPPIFVLLATVIKWELDFRFMINTKFAI
jgi:hypothetical protein